MASLFGLAKLETETHLGLSSGQTCARELLCDYQNQHQQERDEPMSGAVADEDDD